MESTILKEDLIPQLWMAYKKTSEYKSGFIKAIPRNHKLIVQQEILGLKAIYRRFVDILLSTENIKSKLQDQNEASWLKEWKQMHQMLFEHVFKNRGNFRKTEVRFGNPGDEELYKIPKPEMVHYELTMFAQNLHSFLLMKTVNYDEKFTILAKIHYQFIRIHPFLDGNGRIARALTDKIAIYFDLPPAMGGFPRHDFKRRQAYHKAIESCIKDPECKKLAMWIKSYIDIQLLRIA